MGAFEPLAGFAEDAAAGFQAFRAFAATLLGDGPPLRAAKPPPPALLAAARAARAIETADAPAALAFFDAHFEPRPLGRGFLTGYYEPWVEGARAPSPDFAAPLLARPADLVAFAPGQGPAGFDPALAGAQRRPDETLIPYPTRAEIEAAGRDPIVWLQDEVEAFLIQVQGSARVRLRDGGWRRLIYDGRNGRPYTSIGRLLIEAGEMRPTEMSLARLKGWLRSHADRAHAVMQRNESFIFFRLADDGPGPIGGAGAPLTPLRSLAVDRNEWSYGLPFYPLATLPWREDTPEPFARLMIAEDTGSAIVGPARADSLFFGGGEAAGARAGSIRHDAEMFVLWPREAAR